MSASNILASIARRGATLDPAVLVEILRLCPGVDPAFIEAHFSWVRNLPKYLRLFSPPQIAQHLRLLNELNDQQLVAVSILPWDEIDTFGIEVAGIDQVGVTACFTACLADMGLCILEMEAVTYELREEATNQQDQPAGAAALNNKYVMIFRVRGNVGDEEAGNLKHKLSARFKAAYWHLMRGDVHSALQETDDADALVGRILENRFQLERKLAEGGMGTVYLATQLDLDRPVIIKLLRADLGQSEEMVENFLREARLLAKAQSAQVVQVHAAGLAEDRCWMALEYMTGGDLAHWIKRFGTPPVALAARWFHDALAGLRYIHRDLGLVHCDLKPANLLLDGVQNLKIGDLGLSQFWRLTHILKTDGSVRGTPWYMAPEQARGEPLDERSDLFSLGSTFFHILTGTLPFQATNYTELLAKVSRAEHQSLREAAPDVALPLSVVIQRLMQADPLERYQNAEVALADLESYLRRGLLGQRGASFRPAGDPGLPETITPGSLPPRTNSW
jgi:hypothetical protein